MRISFALACLALAASAANSTPINTNDPTEYAAFASGATIVDFESVSGMTPLALSDYTNATNSTTTVPAGAQLSDDVPNVFFHSGGANPNDPLNNPGTPAALLQLTGTIAGDAHSGSNVIGSITINEDTLKLDSFIEIIFLGGNVNRAGVWLNPSLGNVLLTAFDSGLNSLESAQGTAGNFVGVTRATNDIRFISIVSQSTGVGFTADDLTFGRSGGSNATPEPSSAWLALLGLAALLAARRHRTRA